MEQETTMFQVLVLLGFVFWERPEVVFKFYYDEYINMSSRGRSPGHADR